MSRNQGSAIYYIGSRRRFSQFYKNNSTSKYSHQQQITFVFGGKFFGCPHESISLPEENSENEKHYRKNIVLK